MIPGSRHNHPSFRKSFLFALQGFRMALATERNIRIMLWLGLVALIVGVLLGLSALEWAAIFVCCGMVVAAELINTSIETAIDLVSPEFHPLAGRAKDIAAAASWVLALASALVGLCVYGPHLVALIIR